MPRHRLTLLIAIVVLLAACGGGGDTTTTTIAAPTTTAAPATTATTTAAPVTTQPRAEGDATLDFPAEVVGGLEFEVTWTGPDNNRDYVTVVAASAPDGQYGAYVETRAGSPLNLKMPGEPGDLELRYVSGQGDKVLARRPIQVVP